MFIISFLNFLHFLLLSPTENDPKLWVISLKMSQFLSQANSTDITKAMQRFLNALQMPKTWVWMANMYVETPTL